MRAAAATYSSARLTLTALVTGASSGIGFALARLFVLDGHHTVIVARDSPRLTEAASRLTALQAGPVTPIAQDLAIPGAAGSIVARLEAEQLVPDLLVNNAGFSVFGPFAQTDRQEEGNLLQVNILALTELTKAFLPGMLERGRGRIMNVSSTASFLPGPLMAAYYASKAYVTSFSQALAEETRGSGVTVTALCPGPTWSGFQERAGIVGIRMLSGFVMTADDVALAGYQGMLAGRRMVVPGWQNQLVRVAAKLGPTSLALRFVRAAHQRRRG